MHAQIQSQFSVVESVRCLDCRKIYAKPAGGGTVSANPGCPRCGYVGWLPVTAPFTTERRRARSGVDPRQARLVRSG